MSDEEITTLSRHDAAYSALFHKAMGSCTEGALLGAYTDEVTFFSRTRARIGMDANIVSYLSFIRRS